MDFEIDGFIPFGKIHELQITDKELYAIEPLLCDAVYHYQNAIADLRKKLGIPSQYPNQLEMLIQIQNFEGRIVILESVLEQIKID